MSRRRTRKNKTLNGTQPGSPPPLPAFNPGSPPSISVGAHQETETPLTDAFKDTVNKAADRSRSDLILEGKIRRWYFSFSQTVQ